MPLANILVVEDDPTIAMDIRLNLQAADYHIVDVVPKVEKAIKALDNQAIDIVLLDITLKGELTGIDLAHQLNDKYKIPFIYLTSYSDEITLEKAANTFPASYLVKPFKENDLVPAIKMALTKLTAKKNEGFVHIDIINKNQLSQITNTEYIVIQHIWNAKSTQQIADELHISKNTLKTHLKNIYSKLDVHSKTELISYIRNIG